MITKKCENCDKTYHYFDKISSFLCSDCHKKYDIKFTEHCKDRNKPSLNYGQFVKQESRNEKIDNIIS